MSVQTKHDLLGLIRRESAIMFDLRDAADKVTQAADRLCQTVGTRALKEEEISQATDDWHAARLHLADCYERWCEHIEAMQES